MPRMARGFTPGSHAAVIHEELKQRASKELGLDETTGGRSLFVLSGSPALELSSGSRLTIFLAYRLNNQDQINLIPYHLRDDNQAIAQPSNKMALEHFYTRLEGAHPSIFAVGPAVDPTVPGKETAWRATTNGWPKSFSCPPAVADCARDIAAEHAHEPYISPSGKTVFTGGATASLA